MKKQKSCSATEAPQSWHVARFGTNKVTTTVEVTFAAKEIHRVIETYGAWSDTFISRRSARGYAYAPRLSECPSEELEGWKFTVRGVWEDADLRLGCIDELLNDYEGMIASV